MAEFNQGVHGAPLADCPYCDGEGTVPGTALGLCRHCYGTGRLARFLAQRTLERWAVAGRRVDDDGIEDEVPPGYPKENRADRSDREA